MSLPEEFDIIVRIPLPLRHIPIDARWVPERRRGSAGARRRRRSGEVEVERRQRDGGEAAEFSLCDGVANSMDDRLLVVGVVGVWWQVGWPIWTTT